MQSPSSSSNIELETNFVMHKGSLLCVLVKKEGMQWSIFDVLDSCQRRSILSSLSDQDLVKIKQYLYLA
jgi:hypothetical protein